MLAVGRILGAVLDVQEHECCSEIRGDHSGFDLMSPDIGRARRKSSRTALELLMDYSVQGCRASVSMEVRKAYSLLLVV
jgi:hypothetical protein